jgi:hypothetical protein
MSGVESLFGSPSLWARRGGRVGDNSWRGLLGDPLGGEEWAGVSFRFMRGGDCAAELRLIGVEREVRVSKLWSGCGGVGPSAKKISKAAALSLMERICIVPSGEATNWTKQMVFIGGRPIDRRWAILAVWTERNKEQNPLQKGHMKDIGSTVSETVLSLSPIPGGKITN